jgi:hypothetical protein
VTTQLNLPEIITDKLTIDQPFQNSMLEYTEHSIAREKKSNFINFAEQKAINLELLQREYVMGLMSS